MPSAAQAAHAVIEARIAEDDPAWVAAMNAPYDDTPDTDQERADIEEAQALGRFTSGASVREALAAKRPR